MYYGDEELLDKLIYHTYIPKAVSKEESTLKIKEIIIKQDEQEKKQNK